MGPGLQQTLRHDSRIKLTALLFVIVVCAPANASGQQRGFADRIEAGIFQSLMSSSPQIMARRSSIQAAEAMVEASGFASPAILAFETEDAPGVNALGGTVRLGIEREFMTGGRRNAARAFAATNVQTATLAVQALERSLAASVRRGLSAFIGWSSIARRLAAEDSLLVSAEEILRDRLATGDARYLDVLRVRTERLRVQSDRAMALSESSVGRHSLEALASMGEVGRVRAMLDSIQRIRPGLEAPGELPAAPDLDSLLALSGEVRLAEAAGSRIRAARDWLRAEQKPRLSAAIGGQILNEASGRTAGPTLSATISLPFTAARANRAAFAVSDQLIVTADAARAAAVSRVRAQLVAAHARYESARERAAVFDAALLRGAREERESALAAYREGDITLIELLDFERGLARAEVEQIRAHIEAAAALADLLAAGNDVEGLALDELLPVAGGR